MASRGNNNRGRGRGLPFRGRPWGGPRGQNSPGRGSPTPRGGRGRPMYNNLSLIDVDIQRYADENSGSSGYNSPSQGWRGRGRGGRGRGRGAAPTVQNLKVFAPKAKHGVLPPRREEDPNAFDNGRKRIPSRGLGASKYTGNTNVPLSQLLTIDRPYLRPITFVPAQLTPVLFQREEEIIEVPTIIEPEDHVPTAERVARVFSHTKPPEPSFFYSPEDDVFGGTDSEPVVTIDFNSIGTLIDVVSQSKEEQKVQQNQPELQPRPREEPVGTSIFDAIKDALAVGKETGSSSNVISTKSTTSSTTVVENSPAGICIEATSATTAEVVEASAPSHIDQPIEPSPPLFAADPNPSSTSDGPGDITFTVVSGAAGPLGSERPNSPEDEEIIVYEAPNPRSGRVTPSIPPEPGGKGKTLGPSTAMQPVASFSNPNVSTSAPPSFNEISFSFDAFSKVAAFNREQIQSATSRARRLTKKDRQLARKKAARRKGGFGAYGAMLEESHLREEEEDKVEERRQGSDIDWGDGDSEIEKVSSSLGAMSVDSDVDPAAYSAFVKGMIKDGMVHTRIEDLEDAEKMRLEDEEEEAASTSSENDSELDEVLKAEETLLMAEESDGSELDDDEEEEVSSDEEDTPKRSFQARLAKVRSQSAKGKAKAVTEEVAGDNLLAIGLQNRLQNLRTTDSDEDEDDGDDYEVVEEDDDDYEQYGRNLTAADRDEDFIAKMQDILDENQELLSGRDRKQKRAIFKAIRDGDFGSSPAPKKRDYGAHLPPELRSQWEKDRARKAENKRERALARLAVAADPFARHKGGKKGLKDMLRAAKSSSSGALTPQTPTTPNTILDPDSLVRQIRAFVANLGGPASMSLPPMDRDSRAKLHQLALAFKLKSVSKGKGDARYTTLTKTSRTLSVGGVDEGKISRVLRGFNDWSRPGRGKEGGAPRHKEGDEVGKEAPKIGESNIGFKMLSTMGWTEGDSIGASGGLEAPLTAIIKTSKLGLGATREQGKNNKTDRRGKY